MDLQRVLDYINSILMLVIACVAAYKLEQALDTTPVEIKILLAVTVMFSLQAAVLVNRVMHIEKAVGDAELKNSNT